VAGLLKIDPIGFFVHIPNFSLHPDPMEKRLFCFVYRYPDNSFTNKQLGNVAAKKWINKGKALRVPDKVYLTVPMLTKHVREHRGQGSPR
jgi:hypothetical protein